MIITHTVNANGERRIYLGGKSSVEFWIAPRAGANGWTFHIDDAVGGVSLTDADKRHAAMHALGRLAHVMGVRPDQLAAVPFDAIATLHEDDPYFGRRVAAPRRRVVENGFTASAPGVSRQSDFSSQDYPRPRRNR